MMETVRAFSIRYKPFITTLSSYIKIVPVSFIQKFFVLNLLPPGTNRWITRKLISSGVQHCTPEDLGAGTMTTILLKSYESEGSTDLPINSFTPVKLWRTRYENQGVLHLNKRRHEPRSGVYLADYCLPSNESIGSGVWERELPLVRKPSKEQLRPVKFQGGGL